MCFSSAVFQAGGLVVILVEVFRRNFLASIVPVIVNAILNGHQIVVDIVAFVARGDFPRSRLGEKQRGKILGAWVTRKMRTIAQFGIKDDGSEFLPAEARRSTQSFRNGSARGASSLRHAESSTALADLQEQAAYEKDYVPLPTGISEMPAAEQQSILEEPHEWIAHGEVGDAREDSTPTATHGEAWLPAEMEGSHYYEPQDERSGAEEGTSFLDPLASLDGRGGLGLEGDWLPGGESAAHRHAR